MYWVDRKAMREVLRNPFNSKELMKPGIVDKIFKEINSDYHNDFENTWTTTSIPLRYFVDKYEEKTGIDSSKLYIEFEKYFFG